jgi:hypothetical protein
MLNHLNKIKFSFIALLSLISFTGIKAQEVKESKNSIFFEFLGNGGLYSINYERKLGENLYGRIGFCSFKAVDLFGGGESGARITTIPVMLTYLSGQNKSHFEISGGMLFGKDKNVEPGTIIDLIAFIGYRFQAPGEGVLFRVGLTPFLSLDNKANYPDKGFLVSAGISLGYHF